jgi:hypothetical protein
MVHAKMLDKEKACDGYFRDVVNSWKKIEELVMVRTPKTAHTMTRAAVQVFFIVIPVFNEDVVTQVMVPFVAAIFIAMLQLAKELTDPFDESNVHCVPLQDVMFFMAKPSVMQSESSDVKGAIEWMNRGLTKSEWEFDGEPKFPRKKNTYPNKGEMINFIDMRNIADIMNMESWDNFIKATNEDMDDAISRNREMPKHLREEHRRLSSKEVVLRESSASGS